MLEKPGFLQGLCKTIADLKRAGVGADSLREIMPALDEMSLSGVPLSDNRESAKEKLDFLTNVFTTYQKRMEEGGWLDTEDLPLLALNHVSTADCLNKNNLLVIDGFQRLDASRLKLLKGIINAWPDMDMIASVPYWDPHRLHIAKKVSIPFLNPSQPDVIRDGILSDLVGLGFQHAESTAAGCEPPYQTFTPTISSMAGHPCRDHEIRETARSITLLLSEQDLAPQQIAIFCPEAESYRVQLNRVFAEMGIPLDSSHPVLLHGNPLVRDLMELLLLRVDDHYGTSMKNLAASKYLVPLRLLQTMGYETDRLLQAAMQCDTLTNPEQWDNRFETELKKIGLFQSTTQEWLDSLHSFHPEKAGDPSSAVHALLEQLERYDPEAHISIMANQGILSADLLLRDMKALATFRVFLEKTASIWDRLIDRDFDEHGSSAARPGDDQATNVLRRRKEKPCSFSKKNGESGLCFLKSIEQVISLQDLTENMTNGQNTDWYPRMVRDLQTLLDGTDIGYNSTDHAGVRFLPPEMAGGQSYHTVYLLGMNEGVFPRPVSPPILFTERETAMLRRSGVPLADPETERLHGQVLFQAVLATARNDLHLSWCTAGEDGSLMNTSPYVDDIADRISTEIRSTLRSKPVSMRDRVTTMSRAQTGYPLTAAATEMEREYSPYRGAFDGRLDNPLLAQQETDFSFSPSQLNSYAFCPFTYFTERVLRLAREDDEPLNAMNIGTFYHDILCAYHDRSDNVSSSPSGIPLGNPAEKFDSQRLESIFGDLVEKLDFSRLPPLAAVFRKSALLKTLTRFLQLDAANLSRFRQSTGNRLMPVLLEQPFELFFGAGIRLKGIVDRVDLEVNVNHRFTGRYILYDYKKKSLKELRNIVMGEDFQLPLYRTALQSMLTEKFGLQKPECLALLYFSIERQEWKGIVRSDVKTALFEPRKRPQVLSAENMDVLLKWVEDEAVGAVSRIRIGDFRLPLTCPASVRQFDCRYRAICRHDEVRMARKSGMTAKFDEVRMARKSDMMSKMEGK